MGWYKWVVTDFDGLQYIGFLDSHGLQYVCFHGFSLDAVRELPWIVKG